MPGFALTVLALGWLLWAAAFVLRKRHAATPMKVDKRARAGIVLQTIAFWLVLLTGAWDKPPAFWRAGLSILFLAAAGALSWTAVRTLGKQWRIDAGLNEDHELIRSGPYRFIRHPIYASMFCMLLGMAFMVTPWLYFGLAIVIFLVGIEIRVTIEDGLLASRFGDGFLRYRRSVAAYIPGVR